MSSIVAPQLCVHVEPLVQHLRALGLEVTPFASPYGDTTHTWWNADCVFTDVKALRRRLGLADALLYVESFDFAAGADATWTCAEHRIVLIGPHPGNASDDVPRVAG